MSMHIERHVERWVVGAQGLSAAAHDQVQEHDPIQEKEEQAAAQVDAESCRLNRQFLFAHGRPKGELTILSGGSIRGSAVT